MKLSPLILALALSGCGFDFNPYVRVEGVPPAAELGLRMTARTIPATVPPATQPQVKP